MTGEKYGGVPSLVLWEWLVAAYILGIFLIRLPWSALAAAAVLMLIPAAARPGPRIWPLMALCLAAGYIHADLRLPGPPAELPAIVAERQKVELSGTVDEVLTRPGQRLEILLDRVSWRTGDDGGELPGRVAWTWDLAGVRPEPGTEVRIEGVRVKTARGFVNPGIWDYEFYRRLQGVFYRVYTKGEEAKVVLGEAPGNAFERLRDRFRQVLDRYAPTNGPGRGLPQALTMGDRYGLDERVVELFRLASLSHSLALSGMHLGFVAGLGFGLVWLIGAIWPRIYLVLPRPKLAVLAAAPLAAFYIWLGGASPSLVRSGIMFASFGLMLMLGRGRVLVDGLFMALALILIASPLSAFDIRLQFSAAAVAGIIVLFPPGWSLLRRAALSLRERLRGPGPESESGPLGRAAVLLLRAAGACLLLSVCANLALMPLTVWNFGTLNPNILPNLFWLPVLGLVVLPLSLAGMVLGAVSWLAPAGGALLAAAGHVCSWSVGVLEAAARAGLIGEAVPLRPGFSLALGYYGLLMCAAVFMRGGKVRRGALALAAGLVLAAFPALIREWPLAGGSLSVAALDTGQSQALVLELPDGSRALIDGGGTWSTSDFDIGRAVTAPVLSAGSPPAVEFMVMTHPDLDHSRGLVFPLRHFTVGRFAHNGRLPDGGTGEELARAIAAYGREPEVWRAGDVIRAGDGVMIEVLHPPAGFKASGENNRSLALRVVWRGRGMALLPGDLEDHGLRALLDSDADLSARLLVLPHHGGRSALAPELIARARPETAVACAGNLNYRGLPHEDVRAALADAGVPLMVTGEAGWIRTAWRGPDEPLEIETTR